jgi:N-acetylneuraminic acid mutarotase
MKSKSTFVVLLSVLFLSLTASAQWTQRASFPGVARSRSVAFTIDNKIYVMGGYTSTGGIKKDVWEYDIATDTWHQKNDFPGPERYAAVAFVIDGNGYIATGANDFGYLDDLWQYYPPADHWTQNIGLPAGSPQR